MAFRLLDLPLELIEAIGEECGTAWKDETLRALYATSRTVREAVRKPWSNRHFETREIYPHTKRFDPLRAMGQIPEIARSVRRLVFVIMEVFFLRDWETVKTVKEGVMTIARLAAAIRNFHGVQEIAIVVPGLKGIDPYTRLLLMDFPIILSAVQLSGLAPERLRLIRSGRFVYGDQLFTSFPCNSPLVRKCLQRVKVLECNVFATLAESDDDFASHAAASMPHLESLKVISGSYWEQPSPLPTLARNTHLRVLHLSLGLGHVDLGKLARTLSCVAGTLQDLALSTFVHPGPSNWEISDERTVLEGARSFIRQIRDTLQLESFSIAMWLGETDSGHSLFRWPGLEDVEVQDGSYLCEDYTVLSHSAGELSAKGDQQILDVLTLAMKVIALESVECYQNPNSVRFPRRLDGIPDDRHLWQRRSLERSPRRTPEYPTSIITYRANRDTM